MSAKTDQFRFELDLIQNPQIKAFAEKAVEIVPDYFFSIPASSTGKYHPKFSLGEGGLLRHTKAAVRIAFELFRLDWWHFTQDEKDLIITALLIHDGWKSGIVQQKFTVHEHPLLAKEVLENDVELPYLLSEEQFQFILACLVSHMGSWTTAKNSSVVLPKPETKYQKFVHLADYLCSRRIINIDFEAELSKS